MRYGPFLPPLVLCMPLLAQAAQVLERLPLPPVALPPVGNIAGEAVSGSLRPLAAQARELLARHRGVLERDARGMPVVRSVIIALSPDPDALARALSRGYILQEDRQLDGIGQRLVTLLAPSRLGTAAALRELRLADPQGDYDFDHLLVESGAAPAQLTQPVAAMAPPAPVDVRVGLVDAGVDIAHPVFRHRPPVVSGCGGASHPSAHGTGVASLFVGWTADFTGAAPGAQLHAIDVYCGGGAPGGRVRDVVAALSELAAAQCRVINLSIVGPDNAVLAAAVRAVLGQAILVVAATGNDGPNARPLYPAAYPGVIAVSAVDAKRRVLPEASGGAHVSFTAPGADMLAAVPGGGFAPVRGTSFAAPLVAGMLARELARPGTDAGSVVQRLVAGAEDRGSRGRDSRYGHGLVGADLAVSRLMAHPAGH